MRHRTTWLSDLLEPSGRVLVQQTRDQGLVRQALRERPFLNRLEVLAREPNVQPTILAERGLRIAGVAGTLALTILGRLPLAACDGPKQLLFLSIHLHRRTPQGIASWPSDSG